mmetsp:Transcript_22441/g.45218  ORF Transcript_22441/g.45218 Transcript_22441/m.45218 type:complete len:205 (-) Transcript_22441:55-669(-)
MSRWRMFWLCRVCIPRQICIAMVSRTSLLNGCRPEAFWFCSTCSSDCSLAYSRIIAFSPVGFTVVPRSCTRLGCRPSLAKMSISCAATGKVPLSALSTSTATVLLSPSACHVALYTALYDPNAIGSVSTLRSSHCTSGTRPADPSENAGRRRMSRLKPVAALVCSSRTRLYRYSCPSWSVRRFRNRHSVAVGMGYMLNASSKVR